jgi:hypothetical protein
LQEAKNTSQLQRQIPYKKSSGLIEEVFATRGLGKSQEVEKRLPGPLSVLPNAIKTAHKCAVILLLPLLYVFSKVLSSEAPPCEP